MKVDVNRLPEYLGRTLLAVTHSDRPMYEPTCDINYLERRYASPVRLPPELPFEALLPSSAATLYSGSVAIYDIGVAGERPPDLVCAFKPKGYRPQHAMWHNDRLWVLGEDHLGIYDAHLTLMQTIRDPWLAGAHTIVPDGQGRVLVSCAASDAVLTFHQETGHLARFWRVPEALYGHNYPFDRDDSVVDHYVTNDLQLTHINCASPWRGGTLVSLLIQGAIGWSDGRGHYRELVRGFVGCHGVRVRSDVEEIFFADSCTGMLVFLNVQGEVVRRVGTGSRWLHDAVQISGELFALALFDQREVVLLNVATRQVVARIPAGPSGGPERLAFDVPALRSAVSADARVGDHLPDATTGVDAPEDELDRAQLVKQHAALQRFRRELIVAHREETRARDAIIGQLRDDLRGLLAARNEAIAQAEAERAREVALRDALLAEREAYWAHEVAARDASIAALGAQQADEIARRDALLAEQDDARRREIAARDVTIAGLSAQQADEIARRDALLAEQDDARRREVAARDATIAALDAHQADEIARRDAIIAALGAEQSRELAIRDARIAALSAQQADEVARRDAIIAALSAEQAREIATRDAMIAELTARESREVGAREARLAELEARLAQLEARLAELTAALAAERRIVDELQRDLAFATRGWRRWTIGQRPRRPTVMDGKEHE